MKISLDCHISKQLRRQDQGSAVVIAMALLISLIVLAVLPVLISTGESTEASLSTLDGLIEDPSGAGLGNTPAPAATNTAVPLPTNTAAPAPTNTPVPVPTDTPLPASPCAEDCGIYNHQTGSWECIC